MQPASPTHDWRGEIRAMLALAAPVIASQVGMMTMGVVDVAMVGHLSPQALAATGLGNLYVFGTLVFCMGTLFVLEPVVSQAIGAGDTGDIATNVQRGVVLALALSVPAALLTAPAAQVLRAAGQPAEVVPVAAAYAHVSIPGIFPFLAFILLRQTLLSFSRTRAVVATVLVANLANAALDYGLIYGAWGLPELGAVGCAWATSICRALMAVALLGLGWRQLRPLLWPVRRVALAWQPLSHLLRLGAPVGGAHLLEYGAFMATAVLMGVLGTDQFAGHQVAINLASLSFMVPLGLSTAASVRVGYAVGRGDPPGARRAAATSLLLGTTAMLCFAVAFLSMPRWLAGLYSNDEAVLAVAVTLLPVAGLFQVFDGLQVVSSGILRGAGFTRTPMIVHAVGFWVLGVPIGAWLGFGAELGPVGLWWGLVIGLGVAGLTLVTQVRRRLRQRVQRVHVGGP